MLNDRKIFFFCWPALALRLPLESVTATQVDAAAAAATERPIKQT